MKNIFSLGCTFRELLLCCDPVEVAVKATTKDLLSHIEHPQPDVTSEEFFIGQMAKYMSAIEEILSFVDLDYQPDGWLLRYIEPDEIDDEPWINVNLYNWNYIGPPPEGSDWKMYEKDEHNETFSATFSDWKEHASREILLDKKTIKSRGSLANIAAEIMWEATFSGFTSKDVEATGNDVLGQCLEAQQQYFDSKNENE